MTSQDEKSKKAKTRKRKLVYEKSKHHVHKKRSPLQVGPGTGGNRIDRFDHASLRAAARADFNLASLNGSYADCASGFSSITDQPAHTISAYEPVSGVGLCTFDGNGNSRPTWS